MKDSPRTRGVPFQDAPYSSGVPFQYVIEVYLASDHSRRQCISNGILEKRLPLNTEPPIRDKIPQLKESPKTLCLRRVRWWKQSSRG